jgi:integrase/recombinase XerD
MTSTPAALTPADAALIARWLHGRSPQTQRSYRADALAALAHAGTDLAGLCLDDWQASTDHLQARGLSAASIARRCAAIRSLLRFGVETGALPADVGRALRALVLLLYSGALRIGEAVGLRWKEISSGVTAGAS